MNKYHIPKNEQPLKELYVVVSRDEDGNEGVVSAMTHQGAMPMVFGHKRLLNMIRDQLKQMSKDTGKKIYVVKYKQKDVIEIIDSSH